MGDLTISYKKEKIVFVGLLEAAEVTSVGNVKEMLVPRLREDPSNVALERGQIKLIFCGALLNDETMLSKLKLDAHSKITMLASSKLPSPSSMPRVKNDLLGLTNASSSSSSSASSASSVLSRESRFGAIHVLTHAHLTQQDKARSLLCSLANDVGIIAVMTKHNWRVGVLAELYPEGLVGVDPVCVLGLNENMGQRILLRLRTDDLEGFRKMDTIRETLYHELAHNVHSEHDADFYKLMRQVKKEAFELDWRNSSSHTTGAPVGDRYTSSAAAGGGAGGGGVELGGVHILGGEKSGLEGIMPASLLSGTAAILRKTKEEMEMELGCGCSPRSSGQAEVLDDAGDSALCLPCEQPIQPLQHIQQEEQEGEQEHEQVRQSEMQPATTTTKRDDEMTIIAPPLLEESEGEVQLEDEQPQQQHWSILSFIVMQSVDEQIAISLSCDTSFADRLLKLREALSLVLQQNNENMETQDAIEILTFLRLLLGNALQMPERRSINMTAKAFTRLVINISGAKQVLTVAGFEEREGKFVLHTRFDHALLYTVFSFVDSCIQKIDEALFLVD